MRWLAERAETATGTKQELQDIVNVLLEELVKHRYVLPGFMILLRIARAARDKVDTAIYDRTLSALDAAARQRLDALLDSYGGKTDWDRLKREPKRPTTREVASLLQHIRWLGTHANGLPDLRDVAAAKLAQLTLEARALDAAAMKSLPVNKRCTLTVLLIQSQLRKATDDIAEIFVKTVRKMDGGAGRRLQEYQLEHRRQVERLPNATSTWPMPTTTTSRSCCGPTATNVRWCLSVCRCCNHNRPTAMQRSRRRSRGKRNTATATKNTCCRSARQMRRNWT